MVAQLEFGYEANKACTMVLQYRRSKRTLVRIMASQDSYKCMLQISLTARTKSDFEVKL